ncbi:hypothetical protein PC116_g30357 [Phytophthora cactorum]|nr:hypothetical protein PC116_g30357 [Phytophthora cactorum]
MFGVSVFGVTSRSFAFISGMTVSSLMMIIVILMAN